MREKRERFSLKGFGGEASKMLTLLLTNAIIGAFVEGSRFRFSTDAPLEAAGFFIFDT